MLFAAIGESVYAPWSGYIYFLIIPVLTTHGRITGKRLKKLEASLVVSTQKDVNDSDGNGGLLSTS